MRPFLQEYLMRRLLHYLINNIREHRGNDSNLLIVFY
ncbi:DUF2770 family protein, partial [Escherichia coli]